MIYVPTVCLWENIFIHATFFTHCTCLFNFLGVYAEEVEALLVQHKKFSELVTKMGGIKVSLLCVFNSKNKK